MCRHCLLLLVHFHLVINKNKNDQMTEARSRGFLPSIHLAWLLKTYPVMAEENEKKNDVACEHTSLFSASVHLIIRKG